MIKRLYLLLLPLIVMGCTDKTSSFTTYNGTVVEQNSLSPMPNLRVTITDGTRIYSEAVTNNLGQFSMVFVHNSSLGHLYIDIDGNGVYPSKRLDLIYTDKENYDYGLIYLYNHTDASLYPQIDNVAWDYSNGGNTMRFKDIIIKSDYSITDAYVEISRNEDFAQCEKYHLAVQANGTYSVSVDNLTVGVQYFFRVVASNTIGTGRSSVYSRVFGMPIPVIQELINATINSATITMTIAEEPISTLHAGLCWSTSHNPSVNNNTASGRLSGVSEITISGLNFRTMTYYVRAYAQNANGIAYSEELVLPVNNPYSLPTFTSEGYTYTYLYLGYGSWYTAYNACNSLVYVFDDWTLPPINIMPDFFNTYYAENGETLPLPVWSRQRYEEDENGESETFMLTYNGSIWVSKDLLANYYAVRKYKN